MRRSSKKRVLVAGSLALGGVLAPHAPALAETRIGQLARGGISTDASAIFTPAGDDSNTFYAGPDLQIVMPPDATVTSAYLVVAGQYNGFVDDDAVGDAVLLSGVALANATLVEEQSGILPYKLYDVTSGFGITGSGSYAIAESAAHEDGPNVYRGITGHQLIVQWESPTAPWTLAEAWVGHATSGQLVTLPAPPACSGTPWAILSVGVGWECAGEQNNALYAESNNEVDLVSSVIGGGDDSGALTPCDSNGAALYTAGSFGFDDESAVGVDGDSFFAEPANGTSANNRLSDELFVLTSESYDLVDEVTFELDGDENEAIHAIVLVQAAMPDFDCDGAENDDDLCPALADEPQVDTDADGIGDACDDDDEGDGVDDENDNCPLVTNPGQEDADADELGDACDDDDDGDGALDENDNCPFDPNPGQEDADADGVGDACDTSGEGGGGAGGSGQGGNGEGAGSGEGGNGEGAGSGEGGSGEGAGSGEGGSGEGAGSGEGGSGEGAGSGEGGNGEGAGSGEGGIGEGPSTAQGSTAATGPTTATSATSGGTGGTGGGDDASSGGAAADDGGCTVGSGTRTGGGGTGWLAVAFAVIAGAWRRRFTVA